MDAAIYATAGLLFVGLLSGLAFLGVHYPRTFDTVSRYLAYVFLVISAFNAGYTSGVENARSAVGPFVTPARIAEAKSAIDAIRINSVVTLALWIIVIFFFGMSLVSHRIEREKKEMEHARNRE